MVQSKKKVCYYCGLKEEECQEIVTIGILKSKRFPQNGVISKEKFRGYWLEVDRKNPNDNYSTNNCVLCCYFCNNDKSDVFNGNEYIEFQNNRVEYLRKLLDQTNCFNSSK
jgi:hypothetical protein